MYRNRNNPCNYHSVTLPSAFRQTLLVIIMRIINRVAIARYNPAPGNMALLFLIFRIKVPGKYAENGNGNNHNHAIRIMISKESY